MIPFININFGFIAVIILIVLLLVLIISNIVIVQQSRAYVLEQRKFQFPICRAPRGPAHYLCRKEAYILS